MLRQIKPFVPAAFALISTHQFLLGPHGGYGSLLCEIYKEGLCLSSILLLPTLIPLSGVCTTVCLFLSCCDSAIIFTTDRLPDVNAS
jgi:hypothetical protein